MDVLKDKFVALLRFSLGVDADFCFRLTPEEWESVYGLAEKQLMLGILYGGVSRLQAEFRPPREIAFQWASDAESTRGLNQKFYDEAARLTRFVDAEGRRSAILKGPANARLYPDRFARQLGDIDIWVDGGKKDVIDWLRQKKLLEGSEKSSHHVHMVSNEKGISVEVHFRPSSGFFNPFLNARLQKYLREELVDLLPVPEGFNVPSAMFALVMQLAHIERHLLTGGVGLRQITDYFILLRSATPEERDYVASRLKYLGLGAMGGAMMWVLQKIFALDASLLLCRPDARRGHLLLDEVLAGGNFGNYAAWQQYRALRRICYKRMRAFRIMAFHWSEGVFFAFFDWKRIFLSIPLRIRFRTLSLRDMPPHN